MSNFLFLEKEFREFASDPIEAEKIAHISPSGAAVLARVSLEKGVNWLYDNDATLHRYYKSDLNSLMTDNSFKTLFNPNMLSEFHIVRKTGNLAAHGNKMKFNDVVNSLKGLFRFWRYVAHYYGEEDLPTQSFNESLIPKEIEKYEITERDKNL